MALLEFVTLLVHTLVSYPSVFELLMTAINSA